MQHTHRCASCVSQPSLQFLSSSRTRSASSCPASRRNPSPSCSDSAPPQSPSALKWCATRRTPFPTVHPLCLHRPRSVPPAASDPRLPASRPCRHSVATKNWLPTWGEPLEEMAVVEGFPLSVDPSEAQCSVDRLVVRNGSNCAALLADLEKDTRPLDRMIRLQPGFPRLHIPEVVDWE